MAKRFLMTGRLCAAAAAAALAGTAALAQPVPGTPGGYSDSDLLQGKGFDTPARNPFDPGGFNTTPAAVPTNIDITAMRRGLQSAAADAAALYDALDRQSRFVPAVRPVMADVIKLRARTDRLARQIVTAADLPAAMPELRTLDGDWRLLSNRLKLAAGLDRTATDLIARIDATDESLSRMLQLGPSLNYRDLIQQTSGLVTAMDRLLEDIDYEQGQSPQARILIIEGQKVAQQAKHLADYAFAQTEYDYLVQDFKLFQQLWAPLAAKLQGMNSRYVERDVQRVQQVERDITTLLLLQPKVDTQQLVYLAKTLERDVDDFFSRAPLKLLIKLPDAQLALPTADEFYGVFENFIDIVNRGENRESLVDAFRYIDGSWRNFNKVYRPLNSAEAQQVLGAIEKDVATLRGALLIQEGYDRTKAAELAATIENLAGHLNRDTQSWLSKARPAYSSDAQREVANFMTQARQMHEAIATGVSLRETRQMSDTLFDSWRRVYGYVIRCQTSERPYLASTSSQTTPALVELRTLLAK